MSRSLFDAREPLPEGACLHLDDGTLITIRSCVSAGGSALIYRVQHEENGLPVILKELFPHGCVRRNGGPVPNGAAGQNAEEVYSTLKKQAVRELELGQEIYRETRCIVPARRMITPGSITLPDGTVWLRPKACFLLMDELTSRQGFFLSELLNASAGLYDAENAAFGNRKPGDIFQGRYAVPSFPVTLQAFRCVLQTLRQMHEAGYIHGDLNPGNLFWDGSLEKGYILGASFLDFGASRRKDEPEAGAVCTTAGFTAPELMHGRLPTEKTDVYAAGRLLYCMLQPTAAYHIRQGSDLGFAQGSITLLAGEAAASGISGGMLEKVNTLLTQAAKEDPAERIGLDEMIGRVTEWLRLAAPPVWQIALNLPALNPGDPILGRDGETEELFTLLNGPLAQSNPLVLHGFSGLGKTRLSQLLGHRWKERYPAAQVCYAAFPGSMTKLFAGVLPRAIPSVAEKIAAAQQSGEPLSDRKVCALVLDALSRNLHQDDLFILDHVDSDTRSFAELLYGTLRERSGWKGKLFQQLCRMNVHVVLTTRMDLKTEVLEIHPWEVRPLAPDKLLRLMQTFCPGAKEEELLPFIRLVHGHTMTVSMIARTLADNSALTPSELYRELSGGNYAPQKADAVSLYKDEQFSQDTILGHLKTLFRLQKLDQPERTVLRDALLIGQSGMPAEMFLDEVKGYPSGFGPERKRALKHLIRLGDLSAEQAEEEPGLTLLTVHPLIRAVGKMSLKPTEQDSMELLEIIAPDTGVDYWFLNRLDRRQTARLYAEAESYEAAWELSSKATAGAALLAVRALRRLNYESVSGMCDATVRHVEDLREQAEVLLELKRRQPGGASQLKNSAAGSQDECVFREKLDRALEQPGGPEQPERFPEIDSRMTELFLAALEFHQECRRSGTDVPDQYRLYQFYHELFSFIGEHSAAFVRQCADAEQLPRLDSLAFCRKLPEAPADPEHRMETAWYLLKCEVGEKLAELCKKEDKDDPVLSETTEPRVLQLYLQQKRNDRYAYCAKIYRELLTDAKEHGDALSAQRYAGLEKQTRDEMGKC